MLTNYFLQSIAVFFTTCNQGNLIPQTDFGPATATTPSPCCILNGAAKRMVSFCLIIYCHALTHSLTHSLTPKREWDFANAISPQELRIQVVDGDALLPYFLFMPFFINSLTFFALHTLSQTMKKQVSCNNRPFPQRRCCHCHRCWQRRHCHCCHFCSGCHPSRLLLRSLHSPPLSLLPLMASSCWHCRCCCWYLCFRYFCRCCHCSHSCHGCHVFFPCYFSSIHSPFFIAHIITVNKKVSCKNPRAVGQKIFNNQLMWWFWNNDPCHSHLSSAHNNSLAWCQKIFIFNNQLD